MAIGDKFLVTHSLNCASDMSASSVQYSFVKRVATGVCLCTAETDIPCGVLQNSPARDEEALVALAGTTKLKAGATDLVVGDRLGTSNAARGVKLTAGTSTGYFVVGSVLEIDATVNNGALVSAAIDCRAPARNA